MRRPRRDFDQAMQLVVEGMAPAGVAGAQGMCASTVARWTERAERQARRVDEEYLKLEEVCAVLRPRERWVLL
jgi:hypothetical protein